MLYILYIWKARQNKFTQDRYTETIPHRVCAETNVGEYNIKTGEENTLEKNLRKLLTF